MKPFLLLIGADHRGLGKSSLAAALAARLHKKGWDVTALKLRASPDLESGFFLESKETEKASVKRLYEAGCRAVLHLIVRETNRQELFNQALSYLYPLALEQASILLVESNGLRLDLVPDLFVHLDGDGREIKASARKTRALADIRLQAPFRPADLTAILKRIPALP